MAKKKKPAFLARRGLPKRGYHVELSYSKNPPPRVDRRFIIEFANSTPLEWVMSGVWLIIISSNVAAIRYDNENQELYVQMSKGGRTYIYVNVSENAAKDMYSVSSMGGFVHQRLKGAYEFRKAQGVPRIIFPMGRSVVSTQDTYPSNKIMKVVMPEWIVNRQRF